MLNYNTRATYDLTRHGRIRSSAITVGLVQPKIPFGRSKTQLCSYNIKIVLKNRISKIQHIPMDPHCHTAKFYVTCMGPETTELGDIVWEDLSAQTASGRNSHVHSRSRFSAYSD